MRWVFLAFLKHYSCLALALPSPFSDLEPGHADFVLSAHIVFFSFLLFSKQKGAYTHYIPTPLPHMCTGTCGLAKLHAPIYCASSCVPPSGPTTHGAPTRLKPTFVFENLMTVVSQGAFCCYAFFAKPCPQAQARLHDLLLPCRCPITHSFPTLPHQLTHHRQRIKIRIATSERKISEADQGPRQHTTQH